MKSSWLVQYRFEDVIRNCDVILDSKSYQYESRTIHAEDTLLKKPVIVMAYYFE